MNLAVPKKLGFPVYIDHIVVINLESTALLRSLTLFLHGHFIALYVEFETTLPGDIIGEINWEAEGVI